jgi:selenocysteine lyase/cysteine desulfurase
LAELAKAAPDIAFLSHIMFKTGLRFDGVAELAQHARPDGMWAVLDLYHSFMAMPCDFGAVADRVFLLGGGYKYAMAGEGAGYLHAPPGFGLRPQNTGWFADFGAIEAKQSEIAYGSDASRFWGATFDAGGLYRFNAVHAMLARERLDTAAISDHAAALGRRLRAAIADGEAGALAEAELLRPNADGSQPRFLSLRHPAATAWKAKLLDHDIVTDARDDVLRIGLGLYHDEADIEALCAQAKRALG